MTDLLTTLPNFDSRPFSNLLPSLEKHHVTLSDILSSDASDIAKRAQLPVRQVRVLADAVLAVLHTQLGVTDQAQNDKLTNAQCLRTLAPDLLSQWQTISLLDTRLDATLGGGIPTGYLTEVTGERLLSICIASFQSLLIYSVAVQAKLSCSSPSYWPSS